MMSPDETRNRSEWFKNWNNQSFLDIDFRLIQRLVDQNKKDVEKLEARLERKNNFCSLQNDKTHYANYKGISAFLTFL